MIRILFTGIGRRVELIQAFRQAALVLEKDLTIYGADSVNTAPAIAFCDYYRYIPGMKELAYIDALIKICVEDHIDLVIPTIDTDLLVISKNRERFDIIGTKVLISEPDKITICRDKNLTSKFFQLCGLEAPVTVNHFEEFMGPFPCFIKPKDGSSSINAFKVENREELRIYSRIIGDYVIQPLIQGVEYTVDIFCDFDGKPIYITPRKRLQVRAGEVLKTEIDLDQKIIDECKKLIEKFRPCGPITVQLIRDKNGIDHYIEINPRFGGGAPLSMKAGARSAEAILKILNGERIEPCDFLNKVIYSRFDQSVCIKGSKKSEIKGIIFDLDDTLYSEKEYIRSGYRAIADYLGDENFADEMWNYFEEGKAAIDECLKRLGKETLIAECVKIYREHSPDIHLYDGVIEMIDSLKNKGIKIGIITDGRPKGQRNKLTVLGLDKMITDIIVTDELGGIQFRKPCDITFRILAIRWKLPYENIVYVADNLAKDFQAPKQLGMQSIYFKNADGLYSEKNFEYIDALLGDIREINSYIEKREIGWSI